MGGILVNSKGLRFVNELGLRSSVTSAIMDKCQVFVPPAEAEPLVGVNIWKIYEMKNSRINSADKYLGNLWRKLESTLRGGGVLQLEMCETKTRNQFDGLWR